MLSQGSSQNALYSRGYARHSFIDLFQQIIDVSEEYISVAQVHCVARSSPDIGISVYYNYAECYLTCADSPP